MTDRDPLGLTGQVIAEKYKIERLVGEGGFAVVYRALHTIWDKPVAIKFFSGLSAAPEEMREHLQKEFIQEGALLTDLSSQTAGIVQARDVGTCTTPGGQWMPYMVLEWLEGSPLEDVMLEDRRQQRPWSVEETLGFLARVLPALEVAHARGVAHRDIKPANLFVLGSAARSNHTPIKLLDFGVAKMVSDHAQFKAALARTGVGISSFTPQYGAPEQFTRSYGATGPWTDVYAMALVAVEMLTAKEALEGSDLVQLGFASGNSQTRPTPRARGVIVTDALEAVFQKALAVQPMDRFASAGEFLEAVLSAADEGNYRIELPSGSAGAHSSRGSTPPVRVSRSSTANAANQDFLRASLEATANARLAEPKPRGGFLAPLLATIIILVSITAVFAASDMDGAKETRETLLGMFRTLKGDPATVSSAAPSVSGSTAGDGPSGMEATTPPVCPEQMVPVPRTAFTRGLAQPEQRQRVVLSPYCIDLNEVTVDDYAACVDAKACPRPKNNVSFPSLKPAQAKPYRGGCNFGLKERGKFPVNCVNWNMASQYCEWAAKRLPTEAEWEFASAGPAEALFAWGDEDPTSQHLNGCDSQCQKWARQAATSVKSFVATDDGYAMTAPVRTYEKGRSRLGLYDVAGNVAEWVSDWYADYPEGDLTDPSGPDKGKLRAIRGGSFLSDETAAVSPSARASQNPHSLHPAIGFRCAKTPETGDSSDTPAQPSRGSP